MRTLWRTLSMVIVASLLYSGCGGGGDDGEAVGAGGQGNTTTAPSNTSIGSTTATTAAGGTATTPPSTEQSLLRRRDSRPSDVAETANYFAGGPPPHMPGECYDVKPAATPPSGALLLAVEGAMFAGEATTLCVANFEVGIPVKFQVRRQNNVVWEFEVAKPDAQTGATAVFGTMPLDPTGDYTATATQRQRTATQKFQVSYASGQPTLVVAESRGRGVERTRRGNPIHIGLAGWPAGSQVDLTLYHTSGQAPARFIALFSVTVDRTGQLVRTLETRTDDPTGCYVVNVRAMDKLDPNTFVGRQDLSVLEFCLS